jgi:hypothetical protein
VPITTGGGGPAVESFDGRFLFYSRDNAAGVWKVPVSGGPETQVYDFPDRPAPGKWAMTPQGMYFAASQDRRRMFFFYDVAGQRKTPVAAIASGRLFGPIDVAPDSSSLLATIIDEGTADLKLIEGFR